MSHQQHNNWLLGGVAAAVLIILGGCAAPVPEPVQIQPGKKTVAESLSSLRVQLENAVPLKADGHCLLQYHDENGKQKREHFPVKMWMNPPVEIYMQGDVAFDPKGIVLGSNKDEFWLAVRLKEVSGYWHGRWAERDRPDRLLINPRLVLEALGTVAPEDQESWSLSEQDGFDVLTRQEGGVTAKKIYISTGDYLIRKIEYFGKDGKVVIIMELSKYRKISENFFVPGVVKIANGAQGSKEDSAQIIFGFVNPTKFTDKQQERLFVRPQPQGFKHVYKIIRGNVVEQPK
ncbi:MAG: hypothetical protein JW947_05925 [Sedimentisphaerales bacterium]|nr:hypothetical protein [Sedimentisphaerales bacterium]